MIEDPELLRRFAEEKSEEAFAELVRRRVGLVYSVALRHTHDAHRAEDVTQAVFTALARKAATLAQRPVLIGWLYRSAQFAASDAVRVETRRQAREQEAHTMQQIAHDAPEPDWEKFRPVLDDVLNHLDERDRDAVLLRFFDGQAFAEIGAKLRLTENAARMRVERALEKLHAALARRGVTSTATALGVALANQAGVAAPAGLAAAVTGAALAGSWATGAGVGAAAVGGGLLAFMSTSKTIMGGVAAVAALGISAAVYQTHELKRRDAAEATATAEQAASIAKVRDLETRVATESKRAEAADDDNGKLLKVIEALQVARVVQQTGTSVATEVETTAPLTQELVQGRFQRALQLARGGDVAAALKEFLWCYDEGMRRLPSYTGVRFSFLLNEIAKLGERYPVALAALRERRDSAQQRVVSDAFDLEAAMAFAALNRTLKDEQATLAFYDRLPPADKRRRLLANAAYDELVSSQRYADALAGRPYSTLSALFEASRQERSQPANAPDSERTRKSMRSSLVNSTAKSIEVLVGAGDLENARALATRLLAYDGSEETKSLIQERVTRAGHPELLAASVKPDGQK